MLILLTTEFNYNKYSLHPTITLHFYFFHIHNPKNKITFSELRQQTPKYGYRLVVDIQHTNSIMIMNIYLKLMQKLLYMILFFKILYANKKIGIFWPYNYTTFF